jgi:hypothetical protein
MYSRVIEIDSTVAGAATAERKSLLQRKKVRSSISGLPLGVAETPISLMRVSRVWKSA